MKKKKTFVGVAVLLAVLMLGIGYALVTNITLNITGSATGTPDGSNFVVDFSDNAVDIIVDKSGANANAVVDAKKTGELKASLDVSNLTSKGEKVIATYTIVNSSTDLSANLVLTPTDASDSNFKITAELADSLVGPEDETIVTVTVELLVTPISQDVTKSFDFSVEATPVQS